MKVAEENNIGSYNISSQQNSTCRNRKKMNQKNSNKNKIRVHIGFNAAGTNAKIAAARTKSQTAAIERSLRALLKEAKRYNSDENIIRAIKKSISKAGFKVKALGKEERMENFKKAARAAENLREEIRITKELNGKQRARKRKEKVGNIDNESVYEKQSNYSGSEMDIVCSGVELSGSSQAELSSSLDLIV